MNPTSLRVIAFFVFLGTGVCAQHGQCTGNSSWIGDSRCDEFNNNAECGYDGGDCCYCSCVNGPDFSCGLVGFDCRDPEYMGTEVSDCNGELTAVTPCSTDAPTQLVVNDTTSARSLADAIHCSGGAFSVQWLGSVNISRTIKVTNGTVLHVAGVRPGAAVHAAAGIRLFTVINASLELRNITIAGGYSTFGGAIAAAGSYLSLENTSFEDNDALLEGGALYATLGSIASFGEGIVFNGNHAGVQGGALKFGGASSVIFHACTSFSHRTTDGFGGILSVLSSTAYWKGDTIFSGNTTRPSDTVFSDVSPETYDFWGAVRSATLNVSFSGNAVFTNNAAVWGGALHLSSSELSWSGDAVFLNNTADDAGGALHVSSSNVSWAGDVVFSDNTADGSGGALHVSSSNVSWAGDVVFSNNTADGSGGAIYLWYSDVSWSGDAIFSDNTADGSGGALYAFSSDVFWSGDAVFSDNTADGSGGALYVVFSNVTWLGDDIFSENTADFSGGALFAYSSDVSWSGDVVFSNNTGCALYVHFSNASWSGDAIFSENTGYSASALYVYSSDVSWSGDAIFTNNTSDASGCNLLVSFSDMSWSGDTVFSINTAHGLDTLKLWFSDVSWSGDVVFSNIASHDLGSCLLVAFSDLSWSGDAVFSKITTDGSGVALSIKSSDVSWSGDAVFSNITVSGVGALQVYGSDVSWSGDAVFSSNTAGLSGAALHVIGSDLSWSGDAQFSNNTAGSSGGALYVSRSRVSWSGDAVFSDNTADGSGGALYASFSDVSWSGDAVFSDNTADGSGGALYASFSDVSWSGDAVFSNNTADGSGGALYALSSDVSWSSDTVFFNNTSDGSGGALIVFSSAVSWWGNTVFQRNACRGDGGALAVVAGAEVTFASTNVTFSQNSAHVAGGAVAVKGVGVGPHFTGFTFISNHAHRGGAVYITSSGTTTTEDQSGIQMEQPTRFDRCKFIGNEARATGGAIETGAGLDMIVNTYFASNMARAGGALKLAGIISLGNCTFTKNTSESDEGPAVANSGAVSSITECSFIDNAFNCERGEFMDYYETSTSNGAFRVVCEGCGECDDCTISPRIPACSKELEHTKSTGGNATIETLDIDAGYWRATNTSRKMLKCYNAKACVGGVTGSSNYCSPGYEGPYCSTCRYGYFPSLGYLCNKCSGGVSSINAVAAIVAILVILLVVLLLFCLINGKLIGASRGLPASWRRRLLSLKIIVIVWQITTQFTSVVNVRHPDVYQRFLNFINIVNFDIDKLLSMECIIGLDFHHRLFISTLGPPVALTALGAIYAVHGRRNRPSCHDHTVAVREEGHRKYTSMVLLLTFLVYSSVSSSLFQMFACDELDDGISYLRADYRIDCNSSNHRSLQVYGAFMMVVYTAGIPVLYGILLFKNRQVLMDERTRQEDAAAKSISSLWKLYKPDRFYYELIECARRILLAGVVVFIVPNTVAQVGISLMIAAFFMVLSEMVAPYESLWDAWINRIGHAIVFGTIYLALLLKIDISDEREESQRVFGTILIAGHACMVILVMSEAIVVIYQWIKRSR